MGQKLTCRSVSGIPCVPRGCCCWQWGNCAGTWLGSLWMNPFPAAHGCCCFPSLVIAQGAVSWHSLPPALSECGVEILPSFDALSPSSQAVQELVLQEFLSYRIWSRCTVHLTKLYLISFVLSFCFTVKMGGGGKDKNCLNEDSSFKTHKNSVRCLLFPSPLSSLTSFPWMSSACWGLSFLLCAVATCLTSSTFELHFIGLLQFLYKGTDLLTSPSLDLAGRMFLHTVKCSQSLLPDQ